MPVSAIDDFISVVQGIYGVYLDATMGFSALVKKLEESQLASLPLIARKNPELATVEYLDSVSFMYGKGDPNITDSRILHRTTQGEMKRRNAEGGVNYLFIGNMAIVSLYQYWEDYYREKIAKELGIEKNEIRLDVMGDLRILRRAIVHHAGIALPEIVKCKCINWIREGDLIQFTPDQFEEVISMVVSGCKEMSTP